MLSVPALLAIGGMAGLVMGALFGLRRGGALTLLLVPVGMIVYIANWQDKHPEALRSTSGLDYIFGPIPPTASALVAYGIACLIKAHLANRDL